MNQTIIQKMKQKNKYIKFFEDYRKFSGKTLINIDIQPSYMNDYKFLEDWVKMINQCDSSERIIFMYNGDEYGYSENDYRYWLWEIGVDEDTLESAMFYSKYYGFFRNPMDFGIEDYEIINLVKYMIEKGANDSRNLGKDFWDGFIEKYGNKDIREYLEIAEDCVYIPDVMDFLRNYNNIVICGGGKFQCLKEIEIVLEILGKTYETYDEFIYENLSKNFNNISSILKSLPKNENFIEYLRHTKSFPIHLNRKALIEGYCNDVTIFIKWLFPESQMLMSGDHSFIKIDEKYYDGYNYNGVSKYEDLYFFKIDKKLIKIKPFFDKLNRIQLLNQIFDNTDKIEMLNEITNYNYEYIINTLCSQYKWGNVISSKTKEFEEEETPIDSDDYITKFNSWLFKKFNNPDKFYTNGIKIKTPTDWYGKST